MRLHSVQGDFPVFFIKKGWDLPDLMPKNIGFELRWLRLIISTNKNMLVQHVSIEKNYLINWEMAKVF